MVVRIGMRCWIPQPSQHSRTGPLVGTTGDLYVCSVHGFTCEDDRLRRDFDVTLTWMMVQPDELSLDCLERAESRLRRACLDTVFLASLQSKAR